MRRHFWGSPAGCTSPPSVTRSDLLRLTADRFPPRYGHAFGRRKVTEPAFHLLITAAVRRCPCCTPLRRFELRRITCPLRINVSTTPVAEWRSSSWRSGGQRVPARPLALLVINAEWPGQASGDERGSCVVIEDCVRPARAWR